MRKTSSLVRVRDAAQGETIVTERGGDHVAELRPITTPLPMRAAKKARIFKSMQDIWDGMPQVGDSTDILEEDRNR